MLDLIKDVSPLQLLLMCVGLLFIVFSFKDDITSLFKSIKLPKKNDDIDLTKIFSKFYMGRFIRLLQGCEFDRRI
jgi:hypothetical protein